ncbi:MAG: metallophosphoesterase [Lachnospiraceae bacterium]|nr:metallophosphoesterase [Lachnospiraceae bacterium]
MKRKTKSFFSLLLALAMMVSLTAPAGTVKAGSVSMPEDTAVESTADNSDDTSAESSDVISDEITAEGSGVVSDEIPAEGSDVISDEITADSSEAVSGETPAEGSDIIAEEIPAEDPDTVLANSGEEMLLTSTEADGYVVTFSLEEGASIDIYYTHDYTTADEINVSTAYARSSDTGEIDSTGDGQVNFLVNLEEGYELVSVSADANYKNLKDSSDTGVENLYRLTKITGSVTVTVTTQKTVTATTQSSISLSVGLDETQRNFTWYAQTSGTGTLYLAKNSEVTGDTMPENAAAYSVTGEEATNKSGYYSYQTTVTGLEANTTYAYQLENNGSKSAIYTFTTGSNDGTFSFAMVGDPQIGAGTTATDIEGWDNTLNIVENSSIFSGVDFLLFLGDQVNTANNEEQYDGYLEHSALYGLTTATVIGNHDSSSVAYSEHFNLTDTNDNSYGSSTAGADYYFVYNGVLFMVLNSNNTSAAEHQQFMKDAIEATADQDISWKVVTFHHSIYSVASHALEDSIISRREQLVPIFEDLDIDVVLMGHDHVYARTYIMDGFTPITDASEYDDGTYSSVTDPDGILYVTANSASGSKYYNIQTNVNFEYAAVMNQDYTPNVSRVDVTETSFTITTYETGSMTVVDTFTINKTEQGSDDDQKDDDQDTGDTGSESQGTSDTSTSQTSDAAAEEDVYSDPVISILEGDYSDNVTLSTGTNGEMIVKSTDNGVELSIDENGNKVLTIDGTVNQIDTLPNSLMKYLLNDGNTTLVFTYWYPEASGDDAESGLPYGQLVTITIHPGEATDDDIEWYGPAWLYAKYGASASDSSAADTTGSDTVEPASTGSAKTGDDSLMTIWVLTLLLLAGALTMIDNRLKNHR